MIEVNNYCYKTTNGILDGNTVLKYNIEDVNYINVVIVELIKAYSSKKLSFRIIRLCQA